jgi:diaminopimelate epimerase
MRKRKLFKYEALGNDMIVLDPAYFDMEINAISIQLLCDRHRGIGADGICYGPLPETQTVAAMRFFNPDGSEAEKSGNGLRIFARYLIDSGYVGEKQDEFLIGINNEQVKAMKLDKSGRKIALQMGRISFHSMDVAISGADREVIGETILIDSLPLQITAVSVGNPHCVVFNDDLNRVHSLGPILENSRLYKNRTNVQIVRIEDNNSIRIAIWERGAGHTLASGTSACATAGAAVRNGYCSSPVTVIMDGGSVEVDIDDQWGITLTGEVNSLFTCELEQDLIDQLDSSQSN